MPETVGFGIFLIRVFPHGVMKKGKNFYEHQQRAQDEYITHLRECEHRGEDTYFTEREIAMEIDMLEENFQIKMLDGGEVKIKWEMPCQWVGCLWHLYYCRISSNPHWQKPHEVF